MTYRELAQKIRKFNKKQLDTQVTVFIYPENSHVEGEYCLNVDLEIIKGYSSLPDGHPYLLPRFN